MARTVTQAWCRFAPIGEFEAATTNGKPKTNTRRKEAKPAAFPNHLLDRDLPGWVPETLVARPSAVARAGVFDPTFAQGDDTEWFARARQLGLATVMLNDSLIRKRLHSRSITYGATKPPLASRETLEIARRMIAARRGKASD